MFNGFSRDGIKLLDEIACNNTKEYFLSQKQRYDIEILNINRAYVEEMGEYLQILTPNLSAEPKVNYSLFKIYRDSRFHLDRPIKERIGIIIWQGSGHRMQSSSFYIHYSAHGYFISAGIRWFKPPLLKVYRDYLQDDIKRDRLNLIYKNLQSKGYKIPAAKYKRFPRDCSKDDSNSYLYLLDSLYAYKEFTLDDRFFTKEIVEYNFKIYEELFELQQFAYEMTLS